MSDTVYFARSPKGEGYIGQTDDYEKRTRDHVDNSWPFARTKEGFNVLVKHAHGLSDIVWRSTDSHAAFEDLPQSFRDMQNPTGPHWKVESANPELDLVEALSIAAAQSLGIPLTNIQLGGQTTFDMYYYPTAEEVQGTHLVHIKKWTPKSGWTAFAFPEQVGIERKWRQQMVDAFEGKENTTEAGRREAEWLKKTVSQAMVDMIHDFMNKNITNDAIRAKMKAYIIDQWDVHVDEYAQEIKRDLGLQTKVQIPGAAMLNATLNPILNRLVDVRDSAAMQKFFQDHAEELLNGNSDVVMKQYMESWLYNLNKLKGASGSDKQVKISLSTKYFYDLNVTPGKAAQIPQWFCDVQLWFIRNLMTAPADTQTREWCRDQCYKRFVSLADRMLELIPIEIKGRKYKYKNNQKELYERKHERMMSLEDAVIRNTSSVIIKRSSSTFFFYPWFDKFMQDKKKRGVLVEGDATEKTFGLGDNSRTVEFIRVSRKNIDYNLTSVSVSTFRKMQAQEDVSFADTTGW